MVNDDMSPTAIAKRIEEQYLLYVSRCIGETPSLGPDIRMLIHSIAEEIARGCAAARSIPEGTFR